MRRHGLEVGSVALLGLLGALVATAAGAAVEPGHWGVASGTVIRACWGLGGGCHDRVLAGDLRLEVDPVAGTAAVTAADLRSSPVASPGLWWPFPAPDLLPLTGLEGQVEADGSVRLVAPEGRDEVVDLRLTAAGDGLLLDGTYVEPCCDRFRYELDGVRLLPAREAGDEVLRLHDGRFEVTLGWTDSAGQTGVGRVAGVPGPGGEPVPAATRDSGVLWFFGPDNWEMVVKVLDGCAVNGSYWVFAAASTDVAYRLTVTDTSTGEARTYSHPPGAPAPAVTDTAAFASCP